MKVNSELSRLLIQALDDVAADARELSENLSISDSRLAAIREGSATFTDAELKQISIARGEPWWKLVLGLDDKDSELTEATRNLCETLNSLGASAAHEARAKPNPSSRLNSALRTNKRTTHAGSGGA